MNYPNYYGYNNQLLTNNQQSYCPPVQQMPTIQPNQFTQNQLLINGKIVDSVDMVKVTEVPLGTYAVFPKADLSEIYVKSWNNNGTTQITTFRAVENPTESTTAKEVPSKGIDEILTGVNDIKQILNTALANTLAAYEKEGIQNDGLQTNVSTNGRSK